MLQQAKGPGRLRRAARGSVEKRVNAECANVLRSLVNKQHCSAPDRRTSGDPNTHGTAAALAAVAAVWPGAWNWPAPVSRAHAILARCDRRGDGLHVGQWTRTGVIIPYVWPLVLTCKG